jgi:hypothetical protein
MIAPEHEDPVPVPRQVHCELETLRQMGTHDLLSAEALDAMETYDFDAAKAWALEDPDRYLRAIVAGTADRSVGEAQREETRP